MDMTKHTQTHTHVGFYIANTDMRDGYDNTHVHTCINSNSIILYILYKGSR